MNLGNVTTGDKEEAAAGAVVTDPTVNAEGRGGSHQTIATGIQGTANGTPCPHMSLSMSWQFCLHVVCDSSHYHDVS